MKRLLLLPILILLSLVGAGPAIAQTNVSGDQSGIWTFDNSPYRVVGHVTIPSGQTLNIQPGVEINFQGHFKFNVLGNLQAIGTEDAMIIFTTDTPATGWGGLRVDTNVTIQLEYCRIEHASALGSEYPDYHGGALALLGSNATVRNCVFADNEAHDPANELGMGGAVYALNTTATSFTDCLFIRNHCYGEGGAIKFTGDSDTQITNCEFVENTCNYGGGAVSLYGVYGTTIKGSTFVDNYTMFSNGGAIHTLGFANLLYVVNCTITQNQAVTGDGGGIYLVNGYAYLVNTIVKFNPGMYSSDLFVGSGASAEIYYSNMPVTYSDWVTGHDNIDADPLFVDADDHDVSLQATSPCIDTGVAYQESSGGVVLVDLDPSEYNGASPDIGAFEYLDGIFADGFESSDFGAWSTSVP